MINIFVLDETDLKFQFLIELFEENIPFISKRRTPPVVDYLLKRKLLSKICTKYCLRNYLSSKI